jgi:hypothetical protein
MTNTIPTKQDLLDRVAYRLYVADRFVNQPDTEPTENDLWAVLESLKRAQKDVADILNNEYIG